MKILLFLLLTAAFASARSDDRAFRKAVREHGFVQGFGATDPVGLQRKSGRLLVLSNASVIGDAAQELERQVGEVHKKRHPKQVFAAGKKWSSRIGAFSSEGDVLQVDFDENDVAAADLAASLRSSKKFRFVEPDLLIQRHGVGGFKRVFDRKGYLGPRSSQGDATRVVIAFLDTGLDFDNPLFVGVVKPGKRILTEGSDKDMADASEMDYNGHGTQMVGLALGVAGGFEENAKQNVQVMGVKVMNADGFGSLSDLVKGFQWASEHGAQILNVSAGTPERSELLESVVRSVINKGIVVVASAGNTASEMREYPAAIPGVVSVGAVDEQGRIADFSNHGTGVDLYAQGVGLTSIEADADQTKSATWGDISGTSASTAIVSGAIAVVASQGSPVVSSKNKVLRDAVQAYGTDLQPEIIKVLNLGTLAAAPKTDVKDSLYVSAYPVYKYLGLEEKAAFDVLVTNASATPIKDREIQFTISGAKGAKQMVVRSGALQPATQTRATITVPAKEVCDNDCRIYATVQEGLGIGKRLVANVSVSAKPQAKLSIADVWIDASKSDSSRSLRFTTYNRSSRDASKAQMSVDVREGIGDGYHMLPSNVVYLNDVPSLPAGAKKSFTVALPDSMAAQDRLGTAITIAANGWILAGKRRDFLGLNSDRVQTFYNQYTHQLQTEQALRLLKMHGIRLPELEEPQYLGDKGEYENSFDPKREDGYVSGAYYSVGLTSFTLSGVLGTNLTLNNGLNDVDCADFTFGYSGIGGKDIFDSHFWIVDQADDIGLKSIGAGQTHHSALAKVKALLFGQKAYSDSWWKYGAFDHYRHGDKQTAYWLLGQALHLVGDMSVPEHVDNDNYHGLIGNVFENWMAANSYRWKAEDAWAKGGALNPYRLDGKMKASFPNSTSDMYIADPVRFDMYTTAQIANIFPWECPKYGCTGGYDGNASYGNNPGLHYEKYLDAFFKNRPSKPQSEHDLYDNWELDFPSNTINDDDGDLTTIASNSYVNGIRAVAGMLYYFGIETGQIPKSNAAIIPIQQLLLD